MNTFEYNITRKYGKNASGKYVHLYLLKPRNYFGQTKTGIVVSNKFSKSAVKRNKLKRRFREIIRLNLDKIPQGYWLVVYPRHFAIEVNYEEVNSDFVKTIQKIPVS
jgi:ribonuclease P protein component